MKIKLVEIVNNTDIHELGYVYVIDEASPAPYKVTYTTPYSNGKNGGFIAIPEVGSQVLICQPDNNLNWFYLGTALMPSYGDSLGSNKINERSMVSDDKLYRARQAPMRLSLTSPKGNQLVLSDEYNPGFFNVKAELKSVSGKKASLNDSPLIDAVIIENEHGDSIKISSKANGALSPRSITLECKGRMHFITRESSMDLEVIDGKEINIINSSTGSKRSGPNDATPGNINIISKNADVNITTEADTGTIYLQAKGENGHIVLDTEGQVDIKGKKGVNISSQEGNIHVDGIEVHLNS